MTDINYSTGSVESCDSTVPVNDDLSQRSGYPLDAVIRCCRIRGHEGEHVAIVPAASHVRMCWSQA